MHNLENIESFIAAARGIKPQAQQNANKKIKISRVIGYTNLQSGLTFKEILGLIASVLAIAFLLHVYSNIQ